MLTAKQLEVAGRKLAVMRGMDPDRRVSQPRPAGIIHDVHITVPLWQVCAMDVMNIFMITVALEETIMEERNASAELHESQHLQEVPSPVGGEVPQGD